MSLTIKLSQITESNPQIAGFASMMRVSVPVACAALTNLFQQLSADSSSDSSTTPAADQSIVHATGQQIDGESSGAVDVPVAPQSGTVFLKRPTKDSSSSGSPDYKVLPQHVILLIHEFTEIRMFLWKDAADLARLFCRFTSQTLERQYHLQYRTVRLSLEHLQYALKKKPQVLFLMKQARQLTLDIDREDFDVSVLAAFFRREYWPHLVKVKLYSGIDLPISIIEAMPEFMLFKVVGLGLVKKFAGAWVGTLSALLPNVKSLEFTDITSGDITELNKLNGFKNVRFITCSASENAAIALLETCPQINSLSIRWGIAGESTEWTSFVAKVSALSLQNLTSLETVADIYVSKVPQISSLRRLQLNCKGQFDFVGIENLKNLEYLKLASREAGQTILSNVALLGASASLHSLVLSGPYLLDDEQVVRAIQSLNTRGQLYSLELVSENPEKTLSLADLGVGELCGLRKLTISGQTLSIYPKSVDESFQECKHLQYLSIDFFKDVKYFQYVYCADQV